MSKFKIQISKMGERVVLVEWPQRIDEVILEDLISFKNQVLKTQRHNLLNHTPAFSSLLLQYRENVDFKEMKIELLEMYAVMEPKVMIHSTEWRIPVCYDARLALDLDTFTDRGISHRELVKLHTGASYRVYMIGFLPGFLYLGGLDQKLHQPRKSTPNLKTPKGAIAIGGEQTGIYPMESPGGWHVIGRTPLSLFDINADTPSPISQGDSIKFYEIDLQTYQVLRDVE